MDYLGTMLTQAILIGTLVVQGWAAVDAAIRPTPTYVAAGKLTKPAWLAITIAALVLGLVTQDLLSLFRIAALVASIVYLVDVRPALREVQGGNRW
ncbi:MAG TPA: DUF2516 family protein [Mycobacteriales bacterium]|nr:DUF2516 family protein [Mycobacteriales bacterium]